jgi:2'-5' RNA ligase
MKHIATLNDGGKAAELETLAAAMEYIAANFQIEADELGTWEDEDGTTLVWTTQDAADAAEDNSDVIATIATA